MILFQLVWDFIQTYDRVREFEIAFLLLGAGLTALLICQSVIKSR